MNRYTRTDLAAELDLGDRHDVSETTERFGEVKASTIEIRTEGAAKRLGKPRGKYITIDVGKIWLASDPDFEKAVNVTADKLKQLSCELCGHLPERVLIAGLGNRNITADALGDKTVGLLTVTRHIKLHSKELFEMFGGCEISAVAPGVLGQTGIETAELIYGAVRSVEPELVVAIDSLCARSTDRLATTIQLGSSGISPGSGIGNRRRSLDIKTLGVPVLALGIPTVVDSSTLVIDALERAGIENVSPELERVLNNQRSFYVTPKETDTIISELSRLCAKALGLAFAKNRGQTASSLT